VCIAAHRYNVYKSTVLKKKPFIRPPRELRCLYMCDMAELIQWQELYLRDIMI
jgi:hypothetical protein